MLSDLTNEIVGTCAPESFEHLHLDGYTFIELTDEQYDDDWLNLGELTGKRYRVTVKTQYILKEVK